MQNYSFNDPLTVRDLEICDSIIFKYDINAYAFTIPHRHLDFWDFTILTNGNVKHFINGKEEFVPEKSLFIAKTGDYHYFECPDSQNIRYINISVREEFIRNFLNQFPANVTKPLYEDKYCFPLPEELIFKIENMLLKISPLTYPTEIRSDMLSPIFLLLMHQIFVDVLKIPYTVNHEKIPFFSALSNVMAQPNFHAYTVKDLCEKLNYSRMQLNRLFNKYFNTTPHQYLLDYKLNYAKDLLRNTRLKIIDVAMSIGYATLSQFNKIFKKKFGITPSEYRKNPKIN